MMWGGFSSLSKQITSTNKAKMSLNQLIRFTEGAAAASPAKSHRIYVKLTVFGEVIAAGRNDATHFFDVDLLPAAEKLKEARASFEKSMTPENRTECDPTIDKAYLAKEDRERYLEADAQTAYEFFLKIRGLYKEVSVISGLGK